MGKMIVQVGSKSFIVESGKPEKVEVPTRSQEDDD